MSKKKATKKAVKKERKLTLKEKDQLLKQAGYTQKESRLYRNRSEANVMKLINKKRKENKKSTFKPQTFLKEFKKLLTEKEDVPQSVETIYKEKSVVSKTKSKKKAAETIGEEHALILWKDVTDNVSREYMKDVMEDWKGHSLKDTIQSAGFWRDTTFGEIGQWVVMSVHPDNYHSVISMYTDVDVGYIRVYYGQGKNYRYLLEKIRFMFLAIYQSVKKDLFLKQLISVFQTVNPKVAIRLAKDFDISK